jgi:ribonucleoside-diphosphate reductase alpha chain
MVLPELSANAIRVLEARYLRRDAERRVVETPQQLFERTARAIAHAESLSGNPAQVGNWEEQFYEMLTSLDFLPNSPTLMNAGTPLGQLSACFVLPVEDTIEGIFQAVKEMALITRTGGGIGFSFSKLRPKGDSLSSSGGEASGSVSFMEIFDAATERIKQGGRRRGANMGVLRADHPDILEFITAKVDEKRLQNFNISVGVSDRFMEAVAQNRRYPLMHPRTGKAAGELEATEVFNAIVKAAWRTGDPGLLFLDTINRFNPTPNLGSIEATNPCGEVPLLPYESCNLGSINLAHMIRGGPGKAEVDWEKLRVTVHKAVRFLDNVIEVNNYPIAESELISKGNRKIGLGVMGFAEMLIRLGISYDSDEAIGQAEKIMGTISEEALKASQELAAERGAFPNWKGSHYEARGIRVRNATRTAIAPTGTISIIAGASHSIEPLFALAYRRTNVLDGQTLYEHNPIFRQYIGREGLHADTILDEVWRQGSLKGIEAVPDAIKRLFVTALEIPPERHLQVQAAFQRCVDNSVSKTINLPHEATPQDVAGIYFQAWQLGLKGITIYRYGSKAAQVLELGGGEEAYHYDHGSACDPEECRV